MRLNEPKTAEIFRIWNEMEPPSKRFFSVFVKNRKVLDQRKLGNTRLLSGWLAAIKTQYSAIDEFDVEGVVVTTRRGAVTLNVFGDYEQMRQPVWRTMSEDPCSNQIIYDLRKCPSRKVCFNDTAIRLLQSLEALEKQCNYDAAKPHYLHDWMVKIYCDVFFGER